MKELIQGKKRLHFFQDEKVVNDAISNFEKVFPDEDLFVILSKEGKASLVKKTKNTLFLSYTSSELRFLIDNCRSFQEIICHSLWTELDRLIIKLNHPNITWIIWGADLFEEVLYRNGYRLYFEEDQLYKVRAQKVPVFIYKLLVTIRDCIHYHYRLKALSRINNICSTAPKDIDLLESYVNLKKTYQRKRILYYPIEKMLDEQTFNSYINGMDIWVNNAAGYNGNHVEVFNRLSDFKRKGTVHVPLSYGMMKYAKYVEAKGRELLKGSFDPMLTFIPKEEYYKKFLSSNTFIFGHLRGCATGNVIVALYLGAKVFLFKQNVLYDFFKDKGLVLYSIDDDLSEDNVYSPLSDEERANNRKIIMKYFSSQALLEVIKDNF